MSVIVSVTLSVGLSCGFLSVYLSRSSRLSVCSDVGSCQGYGQDIQHVLNDVAVTSDDAGSSYCFFFLSLSFDTWKKGGKG